MLREQSGLSQSSLECDKIRLQRIEQDLIRQNNQTELDRLFCSSKPSSCRVLSTSVRHPESSCVVLATSGNDMSRVTNDFVRGLMENRKNRAGGVEEADRDSNGSNDTARLSYTQNEVDSGLLSLSHRVTVPHLKDTK